MHVAFGKNKVIFENFLLFFNLVDRHLTRDWERKSHEQGNSVLK